MKKVYFLVISTLCIILSACGSGQASESLEAPPMEYVQTEEFQDEQASNEGRKDDTENKEIDEIKETSSAEESTAMLSDEDFINNLKIGLQARWDLLKEKDESQMSEIDYFINKLVAAEKNSLGTIDDYDFKDDDIKSIAERYYEILDKSEATVRRAYIGDEKAQAEMEEFTKQRSGIIRVLMDEYGLKFDEKYKDDVDVLMNSSTKSAQSTVQSGYDIEEKLKGLDLQINRVYYHATDDAKTFLSFQVCNKAYKRLKDVEIELAIWDENNQPIVLDGEDYSIILDYEGIEVPAGRAKDSKDGVIIDIHAGDVYRVGAIIVSGEFYGDSRFENPFVDEWEDIYVGKEYIVNPEYSEKKPEEDTERQLKDSVIDFLGSIELEDFGNEKYRLKGKAVDHGLKYYDDTREGSFHKDFVSDISPVKKIDYAADLYVFSFPYVELVYQKEYGTDIYNLFKVKYRESSDRGGEIRVGHGGGKLTYFVENEYFDTAQEAYEYLVGESNK